MPPKAKPASSSASSSPGAPEFPIQYTKIDDVSYRITDQYGRALDPYIKLRGRSGIDLKNLLVNKTLFNEIDKGPDAVDIPRLLVANLEALDFNRRAWVEREQPEEFHRLMYPLRSFFRRLEYEEYAPEFNGVFQRWKYLMPDACHPPPEPLPPKWKYPLQATFFSREEPPLRTKHVPKVELPASKGGRVLRSGDRVSSEPSPSNVPRGPPKGKAKAIEQSSDEDRKPSSSKNPRKRHRSPDDDGSEVGEASGTEVVTKSSSKKKKVKVEKRYEDGEMPDTSTNIPAYYDVKARLPSISTEYRLISASIVVSPTDARDLSRSLSSAVDEPDDFHCLLQTSEATRGIGCSSHIPAKAQDQSLDATSVSGRPSNWAVVYLSHLRRCGAEHLVSEECRVLATHHAGLSYEESSRFLKAAQGFPGFQVAQTRGTERVLERVLERVAVDAVGKQPTTLSLPSSSLAPEYRQRKRRVKSTFDSPAETLRSAPAYSGPPETKTAAYGLTGNDTKETAQMCEKRSKERDKRMEGILGESDSRTASHTSAPPSTTGGSPVLDASSLAASKSPWRSSAATICSLHYPSTTSGVSASTSVLQPMQDTSAQLTSDSPLVTPTPTVAFALSAGVTTLYTSRFIIPASDASPPVSCSPAPLSCTPAACVLLTRVARDTHTNYLAGIHAFGYGTRA
ncbi:hypothetical protein DFH06DRAFT_1348679 [Mycena polygramma]|nr:hypothetical protein DFH06DRAFT_1348679 [Mycena polygramma]